MKIGRILRRWRAIDEVSIRDLADEIGISAATLSRLENDENVDGHTIYLLFGWLFAEDKAGEPDTQKGS